MGNPFGLLAAESGVELHIQVLSSQRGFYIDTANELGPVSRESVEYYKTSQQADIALEKGEWTQREYD
ncbi:MULTISPECIES: hypothetical protein [Citrobacter]|uniref:hypothetical protein n=1 Tax=Citrobacter freundii complex sp. CFNIH2 TaxID=2066049 RepID=UPI000C86A02E|nr:hypothetical protein [Citrobacter freundii complex sp. CFNIH2]AUO67196.1 hypothetical protein WM46_22095 [Citrobacter freundii complex sp. CFNIH2]